MPSTATRLTLLVATAVLAGCAINPATGKRQIMLVSEAQEVQMGLQNDKAIVAEMGLYDDPEIGRYVDGIGQELAALSERETLDWSFKVIDDPTVNAFALPGGYIYITRGILAHLNNEAELASVIGHEIGHVTARHSANQMSKAQLAQVGLTTAMVLGPEELAQFGDWAQTGMGLAFLKFSRDDERQADDLGLRYMLRAGYDPRPAADVFETLERVSAAQGGGSVPGWMSTHPEPGNRKERMAEKVAESGVDPNGRTVDQQEFLERLDGIVYGADPRQGLFRDNLFLHPQLDFRFVFPPGWNLENHRAAVLGKSPRGDALISITLAQAGSADAALDEFFSGSKVARMPPAMGSINGLKTAGYGFKAATDNGVLEGRVGYVEYGGQVYQLIGYAAEAGWAGYEPTIRSSIASFDRLTDGSVRNVEPARIRIVRPGRAMSLDEFAQAYDATVPPAALGLLNRVNPDERLVAGQPYKVVTGGPR